MWPTIADRPASAIGAAGSPSRRPSQTGTKPLAASPSSTAIAHPLPRARATLVAPMLPLPTARRSTPLRAGDQHAEGDRAGEIGADAEAEAGERAALMAMRGGARRASEAARGAGVHARPERRDVVERFGARAVGAAGWPRRVAP